MWNWIKKSEIWENIVLIIGVFSLWPTIALRDKPLEAYSGWVGVYRRYLGLLILVLLIILARRLYRITIAFKEQNNKTISNIFFIM